MFHIVLVAPEIPQNTGTIGRLCVCTGARLHLIEPLGFQINESRIRRAGLDYWRHLDVQVHKNWDAYLATCAPQRLIITSSRGKKSMFDTRFQPDDHLVFGNESSGLPERLYHDHADDLVLIPMPGTHARTHNLANAAAIVLYEALRQVQRWGMAT